MFSFYNLEPDFMQWLKSPLVLAGILSPGFFPPHIGLLGLKLASAVQQSGVVMVTAVLHQGAPSGKGDWFLLTGLSLEQGGQDSGGGACYCR